MVEVTLSSWSVLSCSEKNEVSDWDLGLGNAIPWSCTAVCDLEIETEVASLVTEYV